jgi:hypothetical protein
MTLADLFGPVRRAEWLFWGIALAAMVLFLYPADESFFIHHLQAADTPPEQAEYQSYLWHHSMVLVIFLLPLLVMPKLGIAPLGGALFAPGDWRWGATWTLIACAVVTLPTWISSHDPQFQAEYPLSMHAFTSPGLLALFLFSYLLYYIGWEAFFRGFIGYGLIGLGYAPFLALMVQVALSTIIHIGKPQMELIGAIPGGILMGVLAYRSRSLLWPLLFHVYVGFINTGFCWMQRT